jgi:hypothetical protein
MSDLWIRWAAASLGMVSVFAVLFAFEAKHVRDWCASANAPLQWGTGAWRAPTLTDCIRRSR